MFTLEAVQNELNEALKAYKRAEKCVTEWENVVYNLAHNIYALEDKCPGFEPNDWVFNRKLDDAYRAYDEAIEVQSNLNDILNREEDRIYALKTLLTYYDTEE